MSVVILIKSTSRLLALGIPEAKSNLQGDIKKSATNAGKILVSEGKIDQNFVVHETLIWEIVTGRPIVTVKVSVRVSESRLKQTKKDASTRDIMSDVKSTFISKVS
jgi:hypothetical protein